MLDVVINGSCAGRFEKGVVPLVKGCGTTALATNGNVATPIYPNMYILSKQYNIVFDKEKMHTAKLYGYGSCPSVVRPEYDVTQC